MHPHFIENKIAVVKTRCFDQIYIAKKQWSGNSNPGMQLASREGTWGQSFTVMVGDYRGKKDKNAKDKKDKKCSLSVWPKLAIKWLVILHKIYKESVLKTTKITKSHIQSC